MSVASHPSWPPPQPCGSDEVEQLRETVAVQARTIRYLLANYDALLRKVEREEPEEHAQPAAQPPAPAQPPNHSDQP